MNITAFIHWNPSLTIGPIRWYSLCWLIGLALAYIIVRKLFYEQNIAERTIVNAKGKKEKENVFDPLFIYCFLGILIGARLGHCLFYQPVYFLSSGKHLVEMFLPIHFVDGNIQYASNWLFKMTNGAAAFTGYEGLASHGGTLGLIIALILYVRWSKLSVWTVLDNIAIATGTTACFIRLGNLMNSEIIGKVTDVPWAFIFERVDMSPRHPGQLYEAIAYAILFFIMWKMYRKSRPKDKIAKSSAIPQVGTGWYFGFCLTFIFTFRFFIEYTKDVQEAFEEGMMFNMGQLLSIPFIIIGVWCMIRAKNRNVPTAGTNNSQAGNK